MRDYFKPTNCKSCGAEIVFLRSNRPPPPGKRRALMPVDAATVERTDFRFDPNKHISHFATCPNANQHRREE